MHDSDMTTKTCIFLTYIVFFDYNSMEFSIRTF